MTKTHATKTDLSKNNPTTDTQLFTKNFLGKLRQVLDTKCASGVAINRETVCQELGLEPKLFVGTISALVNSGMVRGYEIKRGNFGGIGKVGVARVIPEDARKDRPKKSERFEPEFLDLVRTTLDELTAADPTMHVRRLDVARQMGMPGSDTEKAISLAIATGQIPGYEIKRRRGGGISRIGGENMKPVEKPTSKKALKKTKKVNKPPIFKAVEKKDKKAA